MRAVRPGFSSPAEPVFRRPGRLPGLARRIGARVPGRLLAAERAAAVGVRRRRLAAISGRPGSPTAEQRLVRRITMGESPAARAAVARLGYDGYLEAQLDHQSIDDEGLEELLAEALPTLRMSAAELYRRYATNPGVPAFELIVAAVYRAVYSPRQLFERMVVFWTDHFNIHLFSDGQTFLKPVDDREVIRRHALGSFPELLAASAHSPAMLVYLTNDSNVKGHPNENYARELMELHTLGADNGYDQRDVREVARCFTGWTVNGLRGGDAAGTFRFDAAQHDEGTKRVLGRTIDAGGVGDGERVLEILAGSRRTAKFLARKLLVHFWGYEPRKRAVNRVADAYMESGGRIEPMLRQVLKRRRISAAPPKLKRPFHLMVSSLRGLSAELRNPAHLLDQLFVAGHLPFNWAPPNGYPDSEAFWSGFLLPRWNWATTFLNGRRRSGVDVDLDLIDPSLPIETIVDGIDGRLFGGTMTAATRDEIAAFLEAGKLNKNRIRDAIGMAVASPDFQEY